MKAVYYLFLALSFYSIYGISDCSDADYCISKEDTQPNTISITLLQGEKFDGNTELIILRERNKDDEDRCINTDVGLWGRLEGVGYSKTLTPDTRFSNVNVEIPFCYNGEENLFCDCDIGINNDGYYNLIIYHSNVHNNNLVDEKTVIIDHQGPDKITPELKSGDKILYVSWDAPYDSHAGCYDESKSSSGCIKRAAGVGSYEVVLKGGKQTRKIRTLQTSLDVDGLENKVIYSVTVAAIDKLNNQTENPDEKRGVALEVSGFLDDNVGCFIATATYGSYAHPTVKIFRKFRDNILLQFSLGKSVVRTYYKYSPRLAAFIQFSPFIKFSSIIVLTVISFFMAIFLWNPWLCLIIFAGVLFSFFIKFFPRKYYKSFLIGFILAILMYPAEIFSKPPEDNFSPNRSSVFRQGDFPPKLTTSEAVRQKYDKGTILQLNPGLRKEKKDPDRSFTILLGPMKLSENLNDELRQRYENVYSSKGNFLILCSFDYNLFRKVIGILSINTTFGIYRDGGYGLRNPDDVAYYSSIPDLNVDLNKKSDTSFYFNVFPIELGLSYRARFHRKQYLAPFGFTALGYYPFMEVRSDRSQGLWGSYGAGKVLVVGGGLELNLTGWSKRAQSTFKNEYNIYNLHLNVQTKLIQDLSKKGGISFQDRLLLAGLMFEY